MRIAIISDTHKKLGRAERVIERIQQENIDLIVHAGDVVRVEVLHLLEQTGIEYIAVFGNNDYHLKTLQHQYTIYEEPHEFEREGLTFSVMHYPHYLTLSRDVMIYGHTHDRFSHMEENTLILNPGEVCARDHGRSEYMILTIKKKKFEVEYFSRPIGTDNWESKLSTFKREEK